MFLDLFYTTEDAFGKQGLFTQNWFKSNKKMYILICYFWSLYAKWRNNIYII